MLIKNSISIFFVHRFIISETSRVPEFHDTSNFMSHEYRHTTFGASLWCITKCPIWMSVIELFCENLVKRVELFIYLLSYVCATLILILDVEHVRTCRVILPMNHYQVSNFKSDKILVT